MRTGEHKLHHHVPVSSRARFLACSLALVTLILALPLTAPAHAPAPLSADFTAALVEETFTLIREHALTAPDLTAVLRAAIAAAGQTLTAAGMSPPAPPALGSAADDLPAVLTYVRSVVSLYQPRPLEPLTVAILRGMVREVGDPLGTVFLPADFSRFIAGLRGEHGGVGFQVDTLPEGITVIEVVENGPAAAAGVLAGDVLIDVDGVVVRGRTPDQVMEMVGGRIGSTVTLGVSRGGQDRRFAVSRALVRTVPVRARLLETRIGYVRLLEFSEHSARDVGRALDRLLAAGVAAVVLDLRNNGGGLVEESVVIASHFLPPGLVATEERRAGPLMLLVRPVAPRFTGPLTVLVNGSAASASEIVAGALQDVGTPLVGSRTFGKGTVQTIFTLEGDWGLRLTTARYRTRAGRQVDGVGLQPDVEVAMPSGLVQSAADVQLAAAVQLLRGRVQSAARP